MKNFLYCKIVKKMTTRRKLFSKCLICIYNIYIYNIVSGLIYSLIPLWSPKSAEHNNEHLEHRYTSSKLSAKLDVATFPF